MLRLARLLRQRGRRDPGGLRGRALPRAPVQCGSWAVSLLVVSQRCCLLVGIAAG